MTSIRSDLLVSHLLPPHVATRSVRALQVLALLLGVVRFVGLAGWLRLAGRLDPALLLAVMLLAAVMVVVAVVLFGLALPSLIGISSILA